MPKDRPFIRPLSDHHRGGDYTSSPSAHRIKKATDEPEPIDEAVVDGNLHVAQARARKDIEDRFMAEGALHRVQELADDTRQPEPLRKRFQDAANRLRKSIRR
jgi:hypothetical protein